MAQTSRTTRLEARISPQGLAVVKRAAELQGRSLSDFVVLAAEESARKTIEDMHAIQLSMDDQQRFAAILLDPPELSPALLRAREAHAALIGTNTDAPVSD
jgi:uncharacterized protein (DUF1778 family)